LQQRFDATRATRPSLAKSFVPALALSANRKLLNVPPPRVSQGGKISVWKMISPLEISQFCLFWFSGEEVVVKRGCLNADSVCQQSDCLTCSTFDLCNGGTARNKRQAQEQVGKITDPTESTTSNTASSKTADVTTSTSKPTSSKENGAQTLGATAFSTLIIGALAIMLSLF
jgi:hypothetical protein